jgi:hypothetical protein
MFRLVVVNPVSKRKTFYNGFSTYGQVSNYSHAMAPGLFCTVEKSIDGEWSSKW